MLRVRAFLIPDLRTISVGVGVTWVGYACDDFLEGHVWELGNTYEFNGWERGGGRGFDCGRQTYLSPAVASEPRHLVEFRAN